MRRCPFLRMRVCRSPHATSMTRGPKGPGSLTRRSARILGPKGRPTSQSVPRCFVFACRMADHRSRSSKKQKNRGCTLAGGLKLFKDPEIGAFSCEGLRAGTPISGGQGSPPAARAILVVRLPMPVFADAGVQVPACHFDDPWAEGPGEFDEAFGEDPWPEGPPDLA